MLGERRRDGLATLDAFVIQLKVAHAKNHIHLLDSEGIEMDWNMSILKITEETIGQSLYSEY